MIRTFCLLSVVFCLFIFACVPTTTQISPKEIQARMDLATSFLLKGKPRVSLRYLLPIKEEAKQNADYHFLLGLVYFNMKEFKLAKEEFKKTIKLAPDRGEAWNNLGLCYYNLKNIDLAKNSFEKAMSIQTYLTPEYPAYNLARLYYDQKNYKQAKLFLKKALEFNWRYIPAYNLMSKIYEEEGDIVSSVKTLEKAMEADPENTAILLKLAEGYLKEGEKQKALYLFKRIVKEFPNSDASKLAKDYLAILQ